MSRYNKSRDVKDQQGKRIEGEIKRAEAKYGSITEMWRREAEANRNGKLFKRP